MQLISLIPAIVALLPLVNAIPTPETGLALAPRDDEIQVTPGTSYLLLKSLKLSTNSQTGIFLAVNSYVVYLNTTQSSGGLCAGLLANSAHKFSDCGGISDNHCGGGDTAVNGRYLATWWFSVPSVCNPGDIESAMYEATSPHQLGITCNQGEAPDPGPLGFGDGDGVPGGFWMSCIASSGIREEVSGRL